MGISGQLRETRSCPLPGRRTPVIVAVSIERLDLRMTRNGNKNHTIRATAALFLACLSLLLVPAAATNDLCGATITASLKLDHDLTCSGNGFIVGADGIKIDLNGHTLIGPGSGVGISLSGRTNVSIVAGTVLNFAFGVQMINSTDIVIKKNVFRQNAEGIDAQAGSIGNVIKENEFHDSSVRAIMLRMNSRQNVVKENAFTGNRLGIQVFGGVDNILKENLFLASTLAGIRFGVIATGNLTMENTISSNVTGIEFIVGSIGNTFFENRIEMNDCGIKGPSAGNTFKENVFEGNTVDSCP